MVEGLSPRASQSEAPTGDQNERYTILFLRKRTDEISLSFNPQPIGALVQRESQQTRYDQIEIKCH